MPEISCAFARSRIDFHVVTGVLWIENGKHGEAGPTHLDAIQAWQEIKDWVQAASAVVKLKRSRIGFLGHTYPGMLDMYSDFTQHTAQLGTQIEVLEMCDLADRLPDVSSPEMRSKRDETESIFEISEDSQADPLAKKPSQEEMQWACRVAVALDRLVKDFDLQGLSYYYRGWEGNEYERLAAGMILGNSLLTARGIPTSGEGDLKNCQSMKIMDLIGCGGSYTEFYVIDFDENFLLMGHDGPFHLQIAEGKPILRGLGLFHGKRGYGVSVEARVKQGSVTILTLTQTADGRLKFIAAEGESIAGQTLSIGNTNSRIQFKGKVTSFVNAWCHEGPTHHCALGVGHTMSKLHKISSLLNIPFVVVTEE